MAKRFKLRLSLSSFQFCRPKQSSIMPKDPTPVTSWSFSPVNPKSVDITYPNVPDPPPTTPDHHPLSPKTTAVHCSCYKSLRKTKNHHSYERIEPRRRPNTSSISDISGGGDTCPTRAQRRNKKKKAKASVRRSTLSANSGWFSTDDEDDDEEEETESLVATSRVSNSLETTMKKKKKKSSKVQRQKKVKAPVEEGYAVVKNSEDPCEDFKRSMLEMVMEKQMFEVNELEQLLLCFLSLNSRVHHAAIVEAFSEIWEILFCKG